MATITGTTGDNTYTAVAGDDTYQLLDGNDTIYFNASIDGSGVLTWTNGNDIIISADAGVVAPNYDKIVINFSNEYVFARKVNNDFELSVYSTKPYGEGDPGAVGEVGKITLQDAFTPSIGDRLSRIEGPGGFYFEAIVNPVADAYGHTAIYKYHSASNPDTGVAYYEGYKDNNNQDTQQVVMLTDGSAKVRYYDVENSQTWLYTEITYANYGTGSQTQTSLTTYDDKKLNGTSGNDTLYSNADGDTLTGGAGYDQLRGGAGNDLLDGGADYDSAEYWDATSAVTVNLALGTATGGAGNDTLISIENIYGSGYADTLIGDSNWNWINGQNGNDTLTGGAGLDTFAIWNNSSDYSNDTVTDFQAGVSGDKVGLSTFRFTNYSSGNNPFASGHVRLTQSGADTLVEIDLDGSSGPGGFQTALTLTNVTKTNLVADNFTDTNNSSLTFSPDIIAGSAGNDTYAGTGGDDAYDGLAGNDNISGGIGNDTLYGSAGKDTLVGGAGNDYINGGAVTDRVNYTDLNVVSYSAATAGVTVDLSGISGNGSNGTGYAFGDSSVDSDVLANVNFVFGSTFNDTITGSSAIIFEQIEGSAGNDVLNGGTITDTLNQYNGNRVSYEFTGTAGVIVDLAAGTAVGDTGSNAGSDTLLNFNEVRGSNFADTIFGTNRDDVSELFEGRGGNDSIDGRGGFDILRYSTATGPVTVNLVTGTATGAGVGTDSFTNIEGVFGSNFADVLTGGNAANGTTLTDGKTEIFRGEGGDDIINGGQGYDRVDYTSSTGGVSVTLNDTADGSAIDGLGGIDVLRNIEAVRGSAFNDTLTGSDTALGESFEGREGNDTIDGKGGRDRADYRQSTGAVNINLATGIALDGHGGTDALSNIEDVRASQNFSDTITGSTADNKIEGLDGDEYINGSAGSDSLDGGSGWDQVNYRNFGVAVNVNMTAGTVTKTGGGNDTLVGIERVMGSELNDTITGSSANDDFSGNQGNDTMDGGAGFDNVWYGNATAGIVANLETTYVTGGEGSDRLFSIENIEGSNFADTLIGSTADNYMRGDGGMYAPAPTGSTADSMVGGAGFDVVDYRDDAAGVTINLATERAIDGFGGQDTIEGFEEARGSSYNDSITGSTNLYFERFEGRGGNDTIDGGVITDTLNGLNSNQVSYRNASGSVTVDFAAGNATGAAGNDVLFNFTQVRGSEYNDTLYGSERTDFTEIFEGRDGYDFIDGRGGRDYVSFQSASGAVVASLVSGSATGAGVGTDTFVNVEGLRGSDYDDVLTGGLAANGTVYNDGKIEVFRGGKGNDTIDGGQGWDRVDYTNSTAGVTVTLNDTSDGSASDGLGGTDVLRNIEGVLASDYNDTLTGSDTAIREIFEGLKGDDLIDGNGGVDRVSYWGATTGVNVNLAANTASDGYGTTDTLIDIEQVQGSRDFNDILVGNSADNRLEGVGGNDTLSGADGNDTIYGGDGNDSLLGGNGNDEFTGNDGNDTMDGGSGTDNVWYGNATSGIIANLDTGSVTGGEGSDFLISIENIEGSNFADTLIGSNADNYMRGDADQFSVPPSGSTADSMVGGAGFDVVDYRDETVGVSINLTTQRAFDGHGGEDTIEGFEEARGSNNNDFIIGSTNAYFERFEGRAGDDTIYGGAITDTLNQTNANEASYANAGSAVEVNLGYFSINNGAAQGGAGIDTLYNINQVRGSAFNDGLMGSNRTDVTELFEGRDGNDSIDGAGGFDIVRFDNATGAVSASLVTGSGSGAGVGTDIFINVEGLFGSAFNDSLVGGLAANGTVMGDGLSEFFRGGAGSDTIDGGQGYDTSDYTSSTAAVNVTLGGTANGTANDGMGGTDTLINIEAVRGSKFNDTLTGSNSGAFESFEGREGNDSIDGLGGIDRVDYRNSIAGVTVNLTTGTASDGYGDTDTLINIEHVRGSRDFADVITGNSADNRFEALGGNDTLDGGTGIDTAVYSGLRSAYTITKTLTGYTVSGGSDGVDTLTNIEKLQFSDTTVLLSKPANDFDGDGKSDILWRNMSTGASTIWKSGSDATQQAVATEANQAWQVAAVTDFQGDGKADILWRNSTTGQTYVYNSGNAATGGFLGTVSDLNWKIVGTGDFDGDGKGDILWRNMATGANTIWKSGSDATQQAVATEANQAWQVAAVTDFQGDGKADILWRNSTTGQTYVYNSGNAATGGFLGTVSDLNWKIVGTGDFDGDGKGDILWRNMATGANTIWKSGSDATQQAVTTEANQAWQVAQIADFQGDGKADILWRNSTTGQIYVYNSGNSATGGFLGTVANLDWKIQPAMPLAKPVNDFDGDGKSDILWRNTSTGANTIWKSGNGATQQAVAETSLAWQVAAVADFQGDGKADILWRNSTTGQTYVYNSGNSATGGFLDTVANLDWKIVGAGDFDGDGKGDILWRNTSTGANTIWKSGNGATQQAVAETSLAWQVAAVVDFQGDGKADILWRNSTTGQTYVYNSGNSATGGFLDTVANLDWKIVGAGDFDGDGKGDILWRNTSTGANTIWKSGNGATQQAVAETSIAWQVAAVGDYNGDGKSDILWRNSTTGQTYVYNSGNSATGGFLDTVASQSWRVIDGLETGDLLQGGADNNRLFGTINKDFIYGGAGNDTITGGLGADTFSYLNSTEGNDSITDFLAGVDKLQVTGAGFGGLAAGALSGTNFVSGAAPTAAAPQFLYNSTSGLLSFDADGSGSGVAVNLVTLVGHPALVATDIVVA